MVPYVNASSTVVFADRQYPHFCTEATLLELVPGTCQMVDAAHLAHALQGECRLLISFHGAYFPKACWQDLLHFLERGGNLALFGGMPFTRPVDGEGQSEPEQDVYTRQLYLGPLFQVTSPLHGLELVADEDAALLQDCALSCLPERAGTFWGCYPKMTQCDDHPEEMGSGGPFDTVLQPLIYALAPTATGRQRIATPAFLLDQRSGRFRGGRWLISAWQPATEEAWLVNAEAIRRLILLAAEGPTSVDVSPALACYLPGEAPSLHVTARTHGQLHVRVELLRPGGEELLQNWALDFPPSPVQQTRTLLLETLPEPGLYCVKSSYQLSEGQALTWQSGFWIWDEALVEATAQKRLSAGRDYFYQDGRLFFVYGTTYMDSRVQRRFLHLPNPARWDRDMLEMKAAGVNLLRTGIWTAGSELVPLAGKANEAFLRALDAFIMTICKHDLQLIFTFFTFFPLLFAGENPWLDPRSVEAQQDFVGLLARRYARVELLSWDLINEPSFGDPAKIFSARPLPHYDRFETAAFRQWLAERQTLSTLQLRWRRTPADLPSWQAVRPPAQTDYETSTREIMVRATFQVADYTRFSQEMFTRWARRMVETIRANGGRTLVGVGQDEACTRIAPQFYASAVDYTTTHPWWNTDELLWDMLIDKTPEKPNLIQETGIMQLRDLDGRPWRSEQANAALLERKFVMALCARGAGIVQWLWHPNSYMDNDNENSIGLLRADRSAKPELSVMEEFGRLTRALAGRLLEAPATPDVWVVIPYAHWFARLAPAREGTQKAVRVLGYELGLLPQMVGEQQLGVLARTRQRPRAIIVPAAQLCDQPAWDLLLEYIHDGGTLLVNGVLGRNAYDLPFAPGVAGLAELPAPLPVARYEEFEDAEGQAHVLSFADDKTNYVRKMHNKIVRYQHGAGRLVWCGLPLELAGEGETAALRSVYRQVLSERSTGEQKSPAVLLVRRPLRDGTLILAVTESSRAQEILLEEGVRITLAAERAGALILNADGTRQSFGGLHS